MHLAMGRFPISRAYRLSCQTGIQLLSIRHNSESGYWHRLNEQKKARFRPCSSEPSPA